MKFAIVHHRRSQVRCRNLESGAASFIRLSASFCKGNENAQRTHRRCHCTTRSESSVKARFLCCTRTLLLADGEMRLGNDLGPEASLYKAHLCRQDSTDGRTEYVSTGMLFGCHRLVPPGCFPRLTCTGGRMAGEYVRVQRQFACTADGGGAFWMEEWGSRGI